MIYSFILNILVQAADTLLNTSADSVNVASHTAKAVADTTKEVSEIGSSVAFNLGNIRASDWALVFLGMVIVFASLIVISYTFILVVKIISVKLPKKGVEKTDLKVISPNVTGDVNAAIAAALYLHFQEIHDMENTVLTIERVRKNYSPWSSKIYGIRQLPTKINNYWIIK